MFRREKSHHSLFLITQKREGIKFLICQILTSHTKNKYFVQYHVLTVDSVPLNAPKSRNQKNSEVSSGKKGVWTWMLMTRQ